MVSTYDYPLAFALEVEATLVSRALNSDRTLNFWVYNNIWPVETNSQFLGIQQNDIA